MSVSSVPTPKTGGIIAIEVQGFLVDKETLKKVLTMTPKHALEYLRFNNKFDCKCRHRHDKSEQMSSYCSPEDLEMHRLAGEVTMWIDWGIMPENYIEAVGERYLLVQKVPFFKSHLSRLSMHLFGR